MGRAPDYMNACMMAIGNARHVWGQNDPARGDAAYQIYLHCRRNDVCMTHTFINPMVDRFNPLYDQEPFINAGISGQDDDGIYVTGARMVGTLAPFCDENLSFGAPLGLEDPRDDVNALGLPVPRRPPRPHVDLPGHARPGEAPLRPAPLRPGSRRWTPSPCGSTPSSVEGRVHRP